MYYYASFLKMYFRSGLAHLLVLKHRFLNAYEGRGIAVKELGKTHIQPTLLTSFPTHFSLHVTAPRHPKPKLRDKQTHSEITDSLLQVLD